MKANTLFTKAAAGFGTVALALTLSACSTHSATEGQDYGQIRTEKAAIEQTPSDQVIATAPAPSNAQGVEFAAAPAVIPGPAKVDDTGRVYTSSSAGGSGNASATGLNTNVNIIPQKSTSTVVVTETPAPVETAVVVETPAPAAVVIETPPAAVVIETPAPVVVETTTPMTSSTTTEITHRRMRKD